VQFESAPSGRANCACLLSFCLHRKEEEFMRRCTREVFTAVIVFSASIFAGCGTNESVSDTSTLEDVLSMQRRSDGDYDVICKDGRYIVATEVDLRANIVCNAGGVVPPNNIASIQSRGDGRYNVLCLDGTEEI